MSMGIHCFSGSRALCLSFSTTMKVLNCPESPNYTVVMICDPQKCPENHFAKFTALSELRNHQNNCQDNELIVDPTDCSKIICSICVTCMLFLNNFTHLYFVCKPIPEIFTFIVARFSNSCLCHQICRVSA